MSKELKRVNVMLFEEQLEALKKEAKERGDSSVSRIIRELIDQKFK